MPQDFSEPPHSIESERALVGAVLLAPELLPGLAVNPTDFYLLRHRWLWEACQTLAANGGQIDQMLVLDELERQGRVKEGCDFSYLTELIRQTPTAFNAPTYAARVKETAKRRRLITIAGDIAKAAFDRKTDITEAIAESTQRLTATMEAPTPGGLRVLSLAELLALQAESVDWLLADLIPAGGLAILAGMPASGKTFLALDLALAVATGQRGWGREITASGPALYVDNENAPQLLVNRMRALLAGRNITAPDSLHFVPGQPISLADAGSVSELGGAVSATDARLVVLDSLVRFMGGADENDAAAAARAMGGLRSLANAHGCSVLVVHHLRKSGATSTATALEAVRGSGDLVAAMDSVFIVRGADGQGNLTTAKSRWLETPAPFGFAIASNGAATTITIGDATGSVKSKTRLVVEATREILKKSAGALTRREIQSLLESEGIEASDRTVVSALATMRHGGQLRVEKSGRTYTYEMAR